VVIAVILAIETKSLLLGEGAEAHEVQAIEQAMTAGPEVERIIHMKTLYLGPEELMVAAKVAVTSFGSVEELARGINAVEARVRAAVPTARVIYLEPDVYVAAVDKRTESEPGETVGLSGG